ncbi:MAG: MFS transporter [Planctomycetes bacterium]|nr:MFS transporter [Planctomycetota bacterium]
MRSPAFRMTLFFATSVAMLGVFVPFWPAWLEARGMSSVEIGWLVSAWAWSRGLAVPIWAHFVDQSGKRRAWILALALAATVAFVPFAFVRGFEALLAVTVLLGVLHAPVIPLGENMILFEARRHAFNYASVRWFGSLAFLIVTVLTGRLLDGEHAERAFPLTLVFLAATCVAALLLPHTEVQKRQSEHPPFRELLQYRSVLFVLSGAAILQAAHATYYAFSTLHWKAAGHSTTHIGWLWAEGVVAEILLFAGVGSGRLPLRDKTLLGLAVLGSVVRWSVLATKTDISWLVATQWMHALSFAATHLAAMTYMSRRIPVELSATAQSVYTSVNIAAHASAVALVAPLFDRAGGLAFWPMLPIALAGGLLAWYGMARNTLGEPAHAT